MVEKNIIVYAFSDYDVEKIYALIKPAEKYSSVFNFLMDTRPSFKEEYEWKVELSFLDASPYSLDHSKYVTTLKIIDSTFFDLDDPNTRYIRTNQNTRFLTPAFRIHFKSDRDEELNEIVSSLFNTIASYEIDFVYREIFKKENNSFYFYDDDNLMYEFIDIDGEFNRYIYEKEGRKQKKYDLWQYYYCPKSDLVQWLESEFKISLNGLMSIGIIEKRMTKAGFNCIIKESVCADLINDDNDELNPF